jgi:hypothetical protein
MGMTDRARYAQYQWDVEINACGKLGITWMNTSPPSHK